MGRNFEGFGLVGSQHERAAGEGLLQLWPELECFGWACDDLLQGKGDVLLRGHAAEA